MIAMSLEEFWGYIEQCRQHSDSMPAFNLVLEEMLDHWELPKLAAFHKVMRFDIGVENSEDLWDIVSQVAEYVETENAWQDYGGWLIAQGRDFHEAVMCDPQVALTRIPPADDVWEGESVIF